MSKSLRVLSAGAAKALVEELGRSFREHDGLGVDAVFDAAGAIRAAFEATSDADVVILPDATLRVLVDEGRVTRESIAPLGTVATGIAVPRDAANVDVASPDALRMALSGASALYCPDVERATAGIHFVRVLRAMGIFDVAASRLRPFANGATAMAALAGRDAPADAVGCTQVTEILYTKGVRLVGTLPDPYALTTTYAAAVSSAALHPEAARRFASLLTGAASQGLREAFGFAATSRALSSNRDA